MNKQKWIILAGVLVAAVCGVLVGSWLSDRFAGDDKTTALDEYVGRGDRTGLTGELELQVQPTTLTVESVAPVTVDLTLINKTRKTLAMSGWLTPIPAEFRNNQFPFKIVCTHDKRMVKYIGNSVVMPSHKRKDFLDLRPGERKTITADISRGTQNGRWDLSDPGTYKFEIWYETYLTGHASGVNAWTGMTNHVIVTANVLPKSGRK